MRSTKRVNRAVTGLTTAALASLLAAGLTSAPAQAAAVGELPDPSTPGFDGIVMDVAHRGSTVYVAGFFRNATDANGTVPRRGVAAFDLRTGELLPWDPSVTGGVNDLAVTKAGVVLGGKFTAVHGRAAGNLALVERTGTGAVIGLTRHRLDRQVRTVDVRKKRVYVGGDFTRVGTEKRLRLAAFSRKGRQALLSWRPRAAGIVRDLLATADGIYVAGDFAALNGKRTARNLALVKARRQGGIVKSFAPPTAAQVFDIEIAGSSLYAAVGGAGGYAARFAIESGAERWRRQFDGNLQALAVIGKRVYVGGHFNATGAARRGHAAALTLKGKVTAWNPRANSRHGVETMHALPAGAGGSTSPRLVIGGKFDTVAGEPRDRLAILG